MHLQTTIHQIPRSTRRSRYSTNGQHKNKKGQELANPFQHERSMKIPELYRILQILHTRLLVHCITFARSNAENNTLALGGMTTGSIQDTTRQDVWQASTSTTGFYKTLHRINGCIGLWHGCHTLIRGRTQPTKTHKETQTTPHCILLSHLHSHRKGLWHIRERITSNHQSNHTLETIPHLDRRTIHNLHQPHQPTLLEVPQRT